jgi:hypothetical protein
MAGGLITTGSHPKLLWPGVKDVWGYTYDEFATEYTALFETESSDKAYEEYVQVAGFGLAQVKQQGQGISYDSEAQGATTRAVNVTYALGYIVTMEELDDDLYMQVSKRRAPANARAMRITKEFIGANVYNRAFNATYAGGDGVALCSTAHPLVFGGTARTRPQRRRICRKRRSRTRSSTSWASRTTVVCPRCSWRNRCTSRATSSSMRTGFSTRSTSRVPATTTSTCSRRRTSSRRASS